MPAAQLAIVGARVRTLDPDRPFADGVAISDGTVVAVGEDDQVRACCDGSTEGVDAGELREVSAWALVEAVAPVSTPSQRRDLVARALAAQNAVGLTGIHVMDGSPETLADYRALEEDGRLTARVVVPYGIDPTT